MIRINSRIEFVAFILITFTIAATKSQSLDCNAYTDNLGYFNPAQSCSVLGRFCCGSCATIRFCCDDHLYALNQTTCPPPSPSQPNMTRSSTIIVPVSTSYQDIIKVYSTIYWIKVCLILVPIFILVILLSVAFILCSKTKKARKEEFRLIYTLPTTTLGTVPRSPFRPNFTPRPSIVNEVPKYDSINNSVLVNGAFIIQADELPKYDEFKKY